MRAARISSIVIATVTAALPFGALADDYPEPVVQWGVQEGETCEDIAIAVYGNARHASLVTRYNAIVCTRGAPLRRGMTLVLPARVSEVAPAQIGAMVPNVDARAPGAGWTSAAPGTQLVNNSSVQTQSSGRASIQFLDRSRIFLSENTLVIVFGTAAESAIAKQAPPKIEVDQGEVRAMMSALRNEPVELALRGGGTVQATSKEAVVERKGDRSTIAVFDGSARVTNQGKRVEVPKNFGTRFVGKQAPMAPRPLPAAPTWKTAPEPIVILSAQADAWTNQWVSTIAAKAHRVELSRDVDFAAIDLRQEVPGTVDSFVARKIPAGDYFLRIRSIDKEDFLGIASEPRRTTVIRVAVESGSFSQLGTTLAVTADTVIALDAPPGTTISIDGAAPTAVPAKLAFADVKPSKIMFASASGSMELAVSFPKTDPGVAPPPDTVRPQEAVEPPPPPLAWGLFTGALAGPPPVFFPRARALAVLGGGASTSLEHVEGAPALRVMGVAPIGPVAVELDLRSERAFDATQRSDISLAGWAGLRSSFLGDTAETWDIGAAARFGFPASADALPPRLEGAVAVSAVAAPFALVVNGGMRLVADGSPPGHEGALGFLSVLGAMHLAPWASVGVGVDGGAVGGEPAARPDVGISVGAEAGTDLFVAIGARVAPLVSENGQLSAGLSFGARSQ